MKNNRKRTKTYYRFTAVYFTALFLIAALVMAGVLYLSARELKSQEIHNRENSMKQAAELLENQYQVMEGIALEIGTKIDYRPYRVEQGAIYDIDLLERFKQYTNYSPLANHYFLVYRSVRKIYTSSGNTSYFDYYAPVNLRIPYELTSGVLQRIVSAESPCFDMSGSSALAVFPVRFPGYSGVDSRPASLCFVLSKEQVRGYISRMTAKLPERYGIAVNGEILFREGGFDELAAADDLLEISSAKGKVSLITDEKVSGWKLLFGQNSRILLPGIAGCLILAILAAGGMARFSLTPLDRLIEKYSSGDTSDMENEFWELDSILNEMQQGRTGSQDQLKNQFLSVLLKGNYSETLMNRWAMLGVDFSHPLCCVYLAGSDDRIPAEAGEREELEALSDDLSRVYTAQVEEDPHLVIIVNARNREALTRVEEGIQAAAAREQYMVYAGKPVESPKRLPLSYMSALTESRLNISEPEKPSVSADQLAERLIAAMAAGEQEEIRRAGDDIREFLSDEPLDGVLTRYHSYALAGSVIRRADEKGIHADRAAIYALVLLPDPALVVSDLTELLQKEIDQTNLARQEGEDETARLIVEYVTANAYDPDLSLKAMSDTFGFSADYISSMIKKETGSAFKEYITMLRISEAKRLLESDRSLTVSEVSEKVGYRKASNFSKKYKELTGVLPSQSR